MCEMERDMSEQSATTQISISTIELDAMKSPEDLMDVVEIYTQCAVQCLIETIGQKYPHLVKAQPEVGL